MGWANAKKIIFSEYGHGTDKIKGNESYNKHFSIYFAITHTLDPWDFLKVVIKCISN